MNRAAVAGAGLVVLALCHTAIADPSAKTVASASELVTLYQARKGDTLDGLAVRYLTGARDAAVVARMSGLANPDRIPVGTVLRIPTRLLKSSATTLTALSVTGNVVRVRASGVTAPLVKGDLVQEGDRIATGANAFVTLTKPDGSRITLPSHTTLRVAALHRVLLEDASKDNFVVETGDAEMKVAPLHRRADRFEIRTPAAVAAVRGTEFRVVYDAAKSISTLEVLHGRVAESATETSPAADIVTGQAAQRALGGERRIVTLPAAPELAPPDGADTFPDVTFRIAAPHPGWSYHFVLARDADFSDIFAETTALDGVARFESLTLAPFSARVTAIDENGIEGMPKTYLVERPPPPGPVPGA